MLHRPFARTLAAILVLAGGCGAFASEDAGYEEDITRRAASVLPAELASSALHRVRSEVTMVGPQYLFVVDAHGDTFEVQGMAMLRRAVAEIHALDQLRDVTGSEAFTKSLGETVGSTFEQVGGLITNPVDTVTGVPRGVATMVAGFSQSVSKGRSEYEDGYLAALATVSKYKRRYAAELGIDVYTSNPELQKELNRVGGAGAVANWTPTVAMAPFAGPGIAAYTAFDWTESLNRLVTEAAPDFLRDRNETLLAEMGVSEELRDDFLGHPLLSPRHQTIIVESLRSMEGAAGRELFIAQVLHSESEMDAFTYQQIAEIQAGYHRTAAPVTEIFVHKGLPAAVADGHVAVLAYPADLGRWTRLSEALMTSFAPAALAPRSVERSEVWILGTATDQAKEELAELGIALAEEVGAKFGMMD